MSNTYYTSLTGLLAASYGLQNTSHNITNLQSPGFKRSDVFYSSLGGEKDQGHLGSGVTIAGRSTNFSAGNYLGTNNPTDLAVIGNGFFIVRLKNGELLYTRNGEFYFNEQDLLVDRHSGGLVQGYSEHGALVPVRKFVNKTHPGKATRTVDLAGEFVAQKREQSGIGSSQAGSNTETHKSEYKPTQFTVANIFDEEGKEHTIEFEFEPQISTDPPLGNQSKDGLEWQLMRVSYDGALIYFIPQTIKFDSLSKAAVEGFNHLNLQLPNKQLIRFNIGNYLSDEDKSIRLKKEEQTNSFPTTLNTAATATITIAKQDGYKAGKQINFSFDENGQISYLYDNEQSTLGVYIALAGFDDPEHSLVPVSDNSFRAKGDQGLQIGRANKNGFGSIQAHKIESSNVDSTTEFANIVVLQRMFQACSQMMEIDKQLLEELYKR
ncbi:flagellar hook protein FlgE [Legionella nautarum]|uniref:Flagellar hook protein FlgE n=1 Tax=Legionella nautarum TaxID=45070 RepID=A0A0W0WTW6_9GAMM|nr:flagellar hook-basal body complex protein [Legionella nautarum]KTD35757.1 flagellar hook protein FlgE [Legionella nautarum]